MAKGWKQLKYTLTDESIKNVVCTYNGILFSYKKRNSDMDEP